MRALLAARREGRRFHARVGQRLHLRLHAHGALPPRPRAVRGRLRRTASRRSARAAPIRACRMPRTWPGSWRSWSAATRPMRCSTAMPTSASSRPTRTSAAAPARPTSSRRRARSAACSATRCWALAREHPFARRLVNSGRLSIAATLPAAGLNTPDVDAFGGDLVPGAVAGDAPLVGAAGPTWLLRELGRRLHAAVVRRGAGLGRLERAGDRRLSALRAACAIPKEGDAALRRAAGHRLPDPPRPSHLRTLARAGFEGVRAALDTATGRR